MNPITRNGGTVVWALLFALLAWGWTPVPVLAHGLVTTTPDNPVPDDDDTDCGEKTEGQPVSVFTGTERHRVVDLEVNGLYPIRLVRQYDSRTKYDSPLGYGWAFHHDQRLFEYADNSVVIRIECGKRYRFVQTGGSYTRVANGPRGQLIKNREVRGSDLDLTH